MAGMHDVGDNRDTRPHKKDQLGLSCNPNWPFVCLDNWQVWCSNFVVKVQKALVFVFVSVNIGWVGLTSEVSQ